MTSSSRETQRAIRIIRTPDGGIDTEGSLAALQDAFDALPAEEQARRRVAWAEADRTRAKKLRRDSKRKRLATVGVVAFLLVGLLQFIGTEVIVITPTPELAVVLANDAARTYASPPCVSRGDLAASGALRRTRLREARTMGYEADAKCVSAGGFGMRQSLIRSWLAERGILPQRASRWTSDGDWRR